MSTSENCSEAHPAQMVDDNELNAWFVREVLHLERGLTSYMGDRLRGLSFAC